MEINRIYNKVLNYYKRTYKEVIIFASDYPYIDTQISDDKSEHACNICYCVVTTYHPTKNKHYAYFYGCIFKLLDGDGNIIKYDFKQDHKITTYILYDAMEWFYNDIYSLPFIQNKSIGEYINPKYKEEIIDKLITKDPDRYEPIFNKKISQISVSSYKIPTYSDMEIYDTVLPFMD